MLALPGSDRQLLKMHRGQQALLLGLVLLPSSALLGGLALLAALLLPPEPGPSELGPPGQTASTRAEPLERWGWWLLVSLMLLGAVGARSGGLAWVGLANWIPFIWAFFGFQRQLISSGALRWAAMAILAGTVPVLAVGLLQLVFVWQGPWQSLGGLFIWFMHDSDPTVTPRFTGIFENPNLSGAWLAMVWPLALGLLAQRRREGRRDLPLTVVTVLLALSLLLSGSRNAIGLGLLAVPLVLGWRSLRWFAPIAIAWLGAVWLAAASNAPPLLQHLARLVVPATLWEKVARKLLSPDAATTLAHRSREALWDAAGGFVQQLPPLGYGQNGFRMLYEAQTGVYINHSHNLPLELVLSHGWLVAGLFVLLVALVLIGAWRAGMAQAPGVERAWLVATLVTIGLHGWDIPSFDSRHNVLGWVLLAGVQAYGLSPVAALRPRRDRAPDAPAQPSAASAQR